MDVDLKYSCRLPTLAINIYNLPPAVIEKCSANKLLWEQFYSAVELSIFIMVLKLIVGSVVLCYYLLVKQSWYHDMLHFYTKCSLIPDYFECS